MKVVHNNRRSHLTKAGMLQQAKESEAAGDFDAAEEYYLKIIKVDPHNEIAWNRLMIIYRKRKEWKKELETIKDAISSFEDMYAAAIKPAKSKKVSTLSNAFLKATGLVDNKGKSLHQPGPLSKWTRRKELLQKKLKKK